MKVVLTESGSAIKRICLFPGTEEGAILIDAKGVVALKEALEAGEADRACRIIVLEGPQGAFCQGMDLGFIAGEPDQDFTGEIHLFGECLALIRASRKVHICTVDGAAAGGGVGLAAAADIVIATSRASFGLPELVLGLLPAVILPVLQERLTPQKVRLLCLSSSMDAGRALALGLADRLVENPDKLEGALRGVMKQILRCSPGAIAELKSLQDEIEGKSCSDALEIGSRRTARLVNNRETLETLKAFQGGAPLPWFERLPRREK